MTRTTNLSAHVWAACAALLIICSFGSTHQLKAENKDQVQQLITTGKCAGCDLQKAQLMNLALESADLTNADLSGALVYRVNLRAANFSGAILAGTNFGGSDLTGAQGANLVNAITDEYTTCPDGHAGPCGR
jgi:uncharacterized protein YjbI with pentapeptide repeats